MKTFKHALNAAVLATVTLLGSAPAWAEANLIQNGGFCVDCQTDSWEVNKSESSFFRIADAGNGEGFLYVKDSPATISQHFFSGTAGTPLTLSFDYELQGNDPSRTFSALFNGQVLFSTSASTDVNGAFARATATATAIATGYDQLSFVFDTHAYAIELDNVNVSVTAVPEPSAMMMLGLGLGGLAWVRRRGTDSRSRI